MKNGYITLISTISIGAIATAIAVSVLVLGTVSTKTNIRFIQYVQAKALADACAEDALQAIHDSTSYTGSQTATLGAGSCTFTVTSQGGQSREVQSTGTVGTVVRKVKVIISQINPQITISSWQEVGDF